MIKNSFALLILVLAPLAGAQAEECTEQFYKLPQFTCESTRGGQLLFEHVIKQDHGRNVCTRETLVNFGDDVTVCTAIAEKMNSLVTK